MLNVYYHKDTDDATTCVKMHVLAHLNHIHTCKLHISIMFLQYPNGTSGIAAALQMEGITPAKEEEQYAVCEQPLNGIFLKNKL